MNNWPNYKGYLKTASQPNHGGARLTNTGATWEGQVWISNWPGLGGGTTILAGKAAGGGSGGGSQRSLSVYPSVSQKLNFKKEIKDCFSNKSTVVLEHVILKQILTEKILKLGPAVKMLFICNNHELSSFLRVFKNAMALTSLIYL